VLVLYLGRVMELADRDAIYRRPRHPYTQALIDAVPIPDPALERAKRRVLLAGELPSPLNPPSGCVFRTRCPKATDVCARVAPILETVAPGHEVWCHHWREAVRA
jgi:oligopeptide transport system ATP-binding protein